MRQPIGRLKEETSRLILASVGAARQVYRHRAGGGACTTHREPTMALDVRGSFEKMVRYFFFYFKSKMASCTARALEIPPRCQMIMEYDDDDDVVISLIRWSL